MDNIQIVKSGLHTTVQDLGRSGCSFNAIPLGGALNKSYYLYGQSILGNISNFAGLECIMIAPSIIFQSSMSICLTGADFQWTLNKIPVKRNIRIIVHYGDILKGGAAKTGWIGYILFNKEMVTSEHYRSKSTFVLAKLGGNDGNLIRKSDKLEFTNINLRKDSLCKSYELPIYTKKIKMQAGPEHGNLASSQIKSLEGQYKISTQSNRMGLRLLSVDSDLKNNISLTHSVPVWPGIIQLTPAGELIVVMQDGQTTGGYPRIGYIDEYKRECLLEQGLRKEILLEW